MTIRFFRPNKPPHPLGTNLADNFCGGIHACNHGDPLGEVNLHYGILHGGEDLRQRVESEGKKLVHVDHAFFERTDDLGSSNGYFRFSLGSQANAFVDTVEIDAPRLVTLQKRGLMRLEPKKAIKKNRLIVYQPPSEYMKAHFKLPPDFDNAWRANLRRKFPGMMVLTYLKGAKNEDFWDNVAVVASFNSALGFEAMRRGIDVVMTAPRTLWHFQPGDLNDGKWAEWRYKVFCCIAGRMWNFPEMRNGKALAHMKANGEIPA